MAGPPLLQLTDVSLTFGGAALLQSVTLAVQPGDRLALVGRNGSGKSTLMKVMAGRVEPDSGTRTLAPGVTVGLMEQEPDLGDVATLGDFAAAGLPASEHYRIAQAAEGLKFDPAIPVASASGGERRRAALARLLAGEPELMLLDEPTNHLDIEAIGWLEARLAATRAALVVISHDRAFLRAMSRGTLWLDRGELRRQDRGFSHFEEWRDATWAAEDTARHKLDRQIAAEARWAVEGISARRRRNQGRVRALGALRAERAAQLHRAGTAAMALGPPPATGRRVIEAEGISKRFGEKVILRPFSLRVMRGDRVAFVGPNGVGKTTLLQMLTGTLAPDTGSVRLGTNVGMAVFDQARAALDLDATPWETLTDAPELRAGGRADQVMVRGAPRHVVGYLKDFLFTEAQARTPVRALSGGERARLLLARLMARRSNLLVLDEPTNDLDVETLDLLQDVLGEFDGTVLLVSHDRDFIDRVATVTVALEGDGKAVVYPGGWSDYQRQRAESVAEAPAKARPAAAARPAREAEGAAAGLSFTERHRLEALPALIDRLAAEVARLSEYLAAPDLYARDPGKFHKASEALAERQAALASAEAEWLELEERAETE